LQEQNRTHHVPHWLVALAVLAFIPLVSGFNGRMTIIRQMRQEEQQLAQAIAKEQARRAELEELHAYVKSDAYVEYWARVQARMAYPGEVTVIPIVQEPASAPLSSAPASPPPASPLDEWWAVFFGPFDP
jgi:cell division protein FtsB